VVFLHPSKNQIKSRPRDSFEVGLMSNVLSEMREFLAQEFKACAIESEVADSIISKFEEDFRKDYGGIPLYIRKSKELTSRNDEIWSKFTGKNHIELCREYNLSYQQICKIIGLQRKKRQGDLFS
jgi:Mor family transcriptional regulator